MEESERSNLHTNIKLTMAESKDDVLVLKVRNDFTKEIYESRYKEVSLKALKANNPEINAIEVVGG